MLIRAVERLDITAATQARPGETLDLSCAVLPSNDAAHHIIRIDVRRPDGTWSEAYGRNLVAMGGRAHTAVPLALNDPPGVWGVVARDVASGISAERVFRLTER